MADVKWIKIATDVFDDDKILLIESMPDPDAVIVIWFKLLCLAGKQNNSGVFLMNDRIPYTDKMLATIFRRNEATVKMAINIFEQFGMVEILDGVITIPKWSKHQSLDALEAKKARDREYQSRSRAKKMQSSDNRLTYGLTSGDSSDDNRSTDKNRIDKNRIDKNREEKEENSDAPSEQSPPSKKKKGVFQEFAGDDKALLAALRDFNEMRNKKNRKMTDNAKTRLCSRLVSLFGDDHSAMIESINESVYHAWDDVYDHSSRSDSQSQIGKAGNSQPFSAGEIERRSIGNLQGFLDELKGGA